MDLCFGDAATNVETRFGTTVVGREESGDLIAFELDRPRYANR